MKLLASLSRLLAAPEPRRRPSHEVILAARREARAAARRGHR